MRRIARRAGRAVSVLLRGIGRAANTAADIALDVLDG